MWRDPTSHHNLARLILMAGPDLKQNIKSFLMAWGGGEDEEDEEAKYCFSVQLTAH